MKPIIIVCGVPHSFTSMISNFLIDNGAYANPTWDDPKWNMNYSRFEDKEIQNYVNKKKDFKKYDLTKYFQRFPKNSVCIIKSPRAAFYLNEIKSFTDRELKVVYVLRNPEQIILSSMKKSPKSFIFYFERINWMYDFIVNTDLEVFQFVAERIYKDGESLLKYCELPAENINFNSIRGMEYRRTSFIKYRFANLFWKMLSKLFRVL